MPTNPTPLYARLLLGIVRPFPDFDFAFIKPVRRKAVALLRLSPGGRVLDVGCGTGGSFPDLVLAVGATGEVVGVEISPGSVLHARRRVEENGWKNVQVVEAPAQAVDLRGEFDGLLMFAAPDVYASQEALENILPRLRPGGRVVVFGAKTSTRRMGWVLNPLLKWALSRCSLPTTPGLVADPWRSLAAHVRYLEVEDYSFGSMFLASGTLNESGAGVSTGENPASVPGPGADDA